MQSHFYRTINLLKTLAQDNIFNVICIVLTLLVFSYSYVLLLKKVVI